MRCLRWKRSLPDTSSGARSAPASRPCLRPCLRPERHQLAATGECAALDEDCKTSSTIASCRSAISLKY